MNPPFLSARRFTTAHLAIVVLLAACMNTVDQLDERGTTALMRAAARGDTATVHRLIADGADVNAEVPKRDLKELIAAVASLGDLPGSDIGFTALIYAAKNRQVDVARTLVERGASAGHVARYGETALGYALDRADLPMVRLLSTAGARPDARQFAKVVNTSPAQIVSVLLQRGADANGTAPADPMHGRPWELPLLIAATLRGDPDVVKALIDAKANVNARDPNGWTALRWAEDPETQRANARAREIRVVLEAAGARDDGGKRATALFQAVDKKDVAHVREALHSGANPNARNKRGFTPIIVAAYNGSREIVSTLATSGAHVNLIPAHFGPTALTAAIEYGSVPTVNALLAAGARPDLVDGRGWSPLFIASRDKRAEIVAALLADSATVDAGALGTAAGAGDTLIVRMLLHSGADPNTRNALYAAVYGCRHSENTAVVRMLLQAGAKARVKGGWPLMNRAAARCQPEVVRLLLQHGGDPDERDFGGSTPLLSAAGLGKLENVKLLISAGADLDVKDNFHRTVEHRATRHPQVKQEVQRIRDSIRTTHR